MNTERNKSGILIITDLGEPVNVPGIITENRGGGTETTEFSLRPSAVPLWPSVVPLRPSVVFKGMPPF